MGGNIVSKNKVKEKVKVKKLDCSVLNENQKNTLLTFGNVIITKEQYEKSLKLIEKKYFSKKVVNNTEIDVLANKNTVDLNDVTSDMVLNQKPMSIDELVRSKWKRIVKKYTGFKVTLRNSVFENLSHILIIEREKE